MIDAASDRGFYFLVLVIVVLIALTVATISKTRLGRLLRALGDAPVALSTHGLNINATRVLVFCISAFLAGVGGALYGAQLGFVGPSGLGTFQSLIWLSVLVLGGTTLLRAPVIAAGLLVVMPSYLPGSFANSQMMVFGLAALVAIMVVLRPHRGLRVDPEALEARRRRSPVRARFEEERPVQLVGVVGTT
jgi:ABC-type branched-subunit amino acid transport system permease subunit